MFSRKYEEISELVAQWGSPIYIFEKEALLNAVNDFKSAFSSVHPNLIIAYPYKTNNLKEVIKYLHQLGIWAEVTSGIEIEMAKRSGLAPSEIIFNGPYKKDKDLLTALETDIYIYIDNEAELSRLVKLIDIATIPRSPVSVGIRVTSSGLVGGWSKFGFDIDNGDADKIVKKISKIPKIRLTGIHAHFKSNINDIDLYKKVMRKLASFINRLIENNLLIPKYIDIGSGFAISSPSPINIPNWQVPSIQEYADVVKCEFVNLPEEVFLIVEPGRYLVSSAISLITKIVSLQDNNNKYKIITDAGVHLVPGRDIYQYPIKNLYPREEILVISDIYGCLCDSLDILGSDVELGIPEIDDLICISNVGAYDLVRSFSWNLSKAPVAMIDKNGVTTLIRVDETIEHIWGTQ